MARRHESLIPLSRDHRDALALAFRLHHPSPPGPATAMTPPSTPESRAAEVIEFFRVHLDGHFRAEEEALFPAVAAHAGAARTGGAAADATRALVAELIAEHRAMEVLRDRVASARAGTVHGAGAAGAESGLDAALRDFADLLERHVRREERELFARFETIVPAAEAAAAGPRIAAILATRPSRACDLPPAR